MVKGIEGHVRRIEPAWLGLEHLRDLVLESRVHGWGLRAWGFRVLRDEREIENQGHSRRLEAVWSNLEGLTE